MKPDDENETVLYEVNLEADAAIEGPFDTWLRDHIADLLQFDGFRSAEILEDATVPSGRIRRIVQYRLRDQAALDAYVNNHAPRMRSQGAEKFGDRFSADRRVLAHREEFVHGKVSTENCLNCGEVLTGQHCSHCGQRARVRVLSLWGLLRDVLGLDHIEDLPKARVAFFPLGDSAIELVQGLGPEAQSAKWVTERGQSLYHICLQVEDIDSALDELRDKGIKLIHDTPVVGHGQCRIAFIDPSCTGNILFELAEPHRQET